MYTEKRENQDLRRGIFFFFFTNMNKNNKYASISVFIIIYIYLFDMCREKREYTCVSI